MSSNSGRSGGGSSAQKSKRSFNNSSSSKRSNSTNSKKQKTNQKTLGAAWGSNSLSSSRSSFRNSPFSDFGSYMVEKNKKLHNQFGAQASNSSSGGPDSENAIFRGVSIFVDGFTIPSSQELRAYMLKYGGRYENYFSRYRVTHIICSNLPDSKLKNLRSFSGGLPVVKPAWILESVAANKLLSWVPYQLEQVADNQPRLSAFFAQKTISISESADAVLVKHEDEYTSSKGDQDEDGNSSEMGNSTECKHQNCGGSDDNTHEQVEQLTTGSENFLDMRIEDRDNLDAEDESIVKDDAQTSPSPPSASVRRYCLDNQVSKGIPHLAALGSYGGHSTLTDPNFVENYFKNSRLHFIGTWRNRYRKRFPSLSKGFKHASSNPNSLDESRKTAVIHVDMVFHKVGAVKLNLTSIAYLSFLLLLVHVKKLETVKHRIIFNKDFL